MSIEQIKAKKRIANLVKEGSNYTLIAKELAEEASRQVIEAKIATVRQEVKLQQ